MRRSSASMAMSSASSSCCMADTALGSTNTVEPLPDASTTVPLTMLW